MKTIGILTSGGDAPGMNACLRAVTRRAATLGLRVLGFRGGWNGLLDEQWEDLSEPGSVSDVIQRGGTLLKSSRSSRFYEAAERSRAAAQLRRLQVEGLIAVGGDGTLQGLRHLVEETGVRAVGVPATIDNNLYGTDFTIGFDTAINTAVEAIDRIRDTASSQPRIFYVEVMGSDYGHIALAVGIAGGADAVLLPETETDLEVLAHHLSAQKDRGKLANIVVVAEGDESGGATQTAAEVAGLADLPHRVTVLGHLQRGGTPTARDRILATKLGGGAVEALLAGEAGVMVGEVGGRLVHVELELLLQRKKPLDAYLLQLVPGRQLWHARLRSDDERG